MQEIGNTLKKLREQNGLTRREVSEKLLEYGIDISDKTLYGYESGRSSANADMFLALCKIYKCNNILSTFESTADDVLFTNDEWETIEKYRSLDPFGQETINLALDREIKRIKSFGKLGENNIVTLAEYETSKAPTYLIPYFEGGVSAGNGIYQLNDTGSVTLNLWATELTKRADFIIRVSGSSMEPDYHDGDKVLVDRKVNVKIGEVGIFVKNGDTYIKEMGKGELISRNPEYSNIPVRDFENVVCLGKVIGVLNGSMIAKEK